MENFWIDNEDYHSYKLIDKGKKEFNSTVNQLFSKSFDQFYFISNDRIMFTN